MLLYHFTTHQHLRSILSSRLLLTTESNISLETERAGPDVVWLTTEKTAALGLGLGGSMADKTELRFTVELPTPAVHQWKTWAAAQGSDGRTMTALARSGGAGTWWVSTSEIPFSAWREVRDMQTDTVLLDAENIRKADAVNAFTRPGTNGA